MNAIEDLAPGRTGTWPPIRLPLHQFEPDAKRSGREITLEITPDQAGPDEPPGEPARARLAAAAAFLADGAVGRVPLFTAARMIGGFFLAECAPEGIRSVTVALAGSDGSWAMARVNRRRIGVEKTPFGRVRILHEDETLGIYVLEIAPGCAIPPHAHHVMRERELVLDEGLTMRGQPLARGLAFDWPHGKVHGYENRTGRPLRVLCIDAPRFMPEDEVPLGNPPAPEPLDPLGNYLP